MTKTYVLFAIAALSALSLTAYAGGSKKPEQRSLSSEMDEQGRTKTVSCPHGQRPTTDGRCERINEHLRPMKRGSN